jgi:Na+-driven multidrug efflux pump
MESAAGRRGGARPAFGRTSMATQTIAPVHDDKAVKVYRMAVLSSILLNIAVGFFILLFPDQFAQLLGQPEPFPKTWPRHWGAQLLAINLLYMPGYWNPIANRWPNWLGIGIRLSFAVFFFSQSVTGFVPMGIYDGVSGLVLLVTYLRVPGSRG